VGVGVKVEGIYLLRRVKFIFLRVYNRMASKTLGGSYSRVTQRLHWLMLGLSAVASLALFFIDSLLYKALLALILLAYAAFLARHSHLAALLLPFPVAQRTPPPTQLDPTTPRSGNGPLQHRPRGSPTRRPPRSRSLERSSPLRWAIARRGHGRVRIDRSCTKASPPSVGSPPATSTTVTFPPPEGKSHNPAASTSPRYSQNGQRRSR
jgi:hypothetical protein